MKDFLLIFIQSVVSGTVDPDTFVVQRSYRNNNLKILERRLGEKDSFISMTNIGMISRIDLKLSANFLKINSLFFVAGVNNTKISEDLRGKFCLNDEHLLKLCEIGIYLEERYASPRDIEWAIHKV